MVMVLAHGPQGPDMGRRKQLMPGSQTWMPCDGGTWKLLDCARITSPGTALEAAGLLVHVPSLGQDGTAAPPPAWLGDTC